MSQNNIYIANHEEISRITDNGRPCDIGVQLAKAKANGITDGTAPQAYATREQVAVMIQRTK